MYTQRALLILIAILNAFPIFGGDFGIIPLNLILDENSKTSVLTLTNNASENVTVQMSVKQWTQDERGQDVYSETKDILFFPKIVEMQKGQKVIIRVGYQGAKEDATEKSYRMFLQELPLSGTGAPAVKMILSLNIPIFVNNLNARADGAIDQIQFANGSFTINVTNKGTRHLKIKQIRATAKDSLGKEIFFANVHGWYVLAGSTRAFSLTIPETECKLASVVTFSLSSDELNLERESGIDVSQCTQ